MTPRKANTTSNPFPPDTAEGILDQIANAEIRELAKEVHQLFVTDVVGEMDENFSAILQQTKRPEYFSLIAHVAEDRLGVICTRGHRETKIVNGIGAVVGSTENAQSISSKNWARTKASALETRKLDDGSVEIIKTKRESAMYCISADSGEKVDTGHAGYWQLTTGGHQGKPQEPKDTIEQQDRPGDPPERAALNVVSISQEAFEKKMASVLVAYINKRSTATSPEEVMSILRVTKAFCKNEIDGLRNRAKPGSAAVPARPVQLPSGA